MNQSRQSYEQALKEFLLPMINEDRLALLETKLASRTRYMTVVLEDIYQPHNASAVLRTADCFGVQDVHIIENRNAYELNPDVELGAAQWLTLHKYNREPQNTLDAIKSLKQKGYRIVATTPHRDDVELPEYNIDKGPVAILLGTEMQGLSDVALEHADEYLKIPMVGFTESLNISVSAAIILYQLSQKIRNSSVSWQISAAERDALHLQWIRNSVNNIRIIEPEFKKRYFS